MSSYRQIYTSFWTDNYIMDLASKGKLLFLYLLTSNRSSQWGMFEFNLKDASLITAIKARKLSEMLNKFHKDGKILYEEKTSEIMMVNWFKYNVVCKSCKTRKHVNKELQCIKSSTLLNLFYDKCLVESESKMNAVLNADMPFEVSEVDVFSAFEVTFARCPSQDDANHIYSLIDKFGTLWVCKALKVGFERQAKTMGYIASILSNWKIQGGMTTGHSSSRACPI